MRTLFDLLRTAFSGLLQLTITRPRLTLLLTVGFAILSLWYTVGNLTFETSRNFLASGHAPYIKLEETIDNEFNDMDDFVVVVEPPNPERGKQFIEALAARLRSDPQHFSAVIDRIDTTSLQGKKLLLLTPPELRTLRQRLDDAQDMIHDVAETPGLLPLLHAINRKISQALVSYLTGGLLDASPPKTAAPGATVSGPSLDISFLGALFAEMAQAASPVEPYVFRSPWNRFFLEKDDVFSEAGYLTSDDDRLFFMLVTDRVRQGGFVKHAEPLRALRAHIAVLKRDFTDVRAGVTGGNALNTDEMLVAQQDSIVASVVALLGVALLFILVFGQVWRPLLVVTTLLVAICWTLGLIALCVGHLNILTVAFIPILIGLGIDFGIHLVARYGEERAQGVTFAVAMNATYRHTWPGVVTAALTTTLAFYAVMLTNFRGLAELGFIAGSGMLLCLLASGTVLPALLSLREHRRSVAPGLWRPHPHDPLSVLVRFPRLFGSLLIVLTLAGVLTLPVPSFDYNLLHLQAQGTESVTWEQRLLAASGRSSWYALSMADSLQELYRQAARYATLPAVDHVVSVADVLPEDQGVRLPLVMALAPYVANLPNRWEESEPVVLDDLNRILQKIRFKLQRKATDWDPTKRPSERDLSAARAALLDLQARLGATPTSTLQPRLEAFQRALMADFTAKLDLLQGNVHPTPITLADVPQRLRERFVSRRGRYLLQIFARGNIWERQPMEDFVMQLQKVHPQVTGPPVIAFYSIQQMQRGYMEGGGYAAIVIIGIILLLLRRPRHVLLVCLPVLFGGLWTMAGMALFHIPLNMANLIIVPLFLGIAVDDGIHFVHRLTEDGRSVLMPLTRSTGKAIVLTSLTTMTGFGSLMLARHQGIFSLGALVTLAVGCSLVATYTVLPISASLLRVVPAAPHSAPRHPRGAEAHTEP